MTALNSIKHGILCFTFDDRNFEGWLKAMPLFEKYNAHASFFVAGEISHSAIEAMQALRRCGHTVGLHAFTHRDAPEYFDAQGGEGYFRDEIAPQLSVCRENGIPIKAFAYPNNYRNETTDAYLGSFFSRFRAGNLDCTEEELFVPVSHLPETRVHHGIGIGAYYHTVEGELLALIQRAADTNTCLTFFSHNIAPNADRISMPTELLESCLGKAAELGVRLLGFDELL